MNWVAVSDKNHEVTVVEYDDLLTKKTLDENDNFEDFLTSKLHPTKMEVHSFILSFTQSLFENSLTNSIPSL